jgi:threonine dehydratase
MKEQGASVQFVNGGYAEAEKAGLLFSQDTGAIWVSPYNDGHVISGQSTLVGEILPHLPPMPAAEWLVPVGGGGLISGIAVGLEHTSVPYRLTAVQSEASPFFHSIFHSGTQEGVSESPSLADGLAGEVEDGSMTIPIVRRYVHDFILVSEAEITEAIHYAWEYHNEIIEGSGAVGLAAVLSGKIDRRPAVILISGGNIQPEVHEQILSASNRQDRSGSTSFGL